MVVFVLLDVFYSLFDGEENVFATEEPSLLECMVLLLFLLDEVAEGTGLDELEVCKSLILDLDIDVGRRMVL